MFSIFKRLSELEAHCKRLENDQRDLVAAVQQLDPAELTRLRQTVLNSIRSLTRHAQAAEEREQPKGPPQVHSWARQGGSK